MLAKHRPDIQGSKEELLALKSDPALSRAMTEAYATDNGAVLSNAGLPTTPGNTYLAHFAGPQGAVKVLQADPNAPIDQILGPSAVQANPFLRGMTAADLQAWAARKMGGASQAPTPQPAPATPAAPINAIPPQAAPIFAQQPQQQAAAEPGQSIFDALPAQGAPPPIFAPPRKPIDISRLRAALQASGNRGFFLARG